MSNLMVHKLKSHGQASEEVTAPSKRSAAKDRFSCPLCGDKFQKRARLTSHEEEKHNLVRSSKTSSSHEYRTGFGDIFFVQVLKSWYIYSVT